MASLDVQVEMPKTVPLQPYGCLFGYDCPPGISPTFSKVSFIGKKVTSSLLSDIHVRDVLLLDRCHGISGADVSLIIDHIQNVKVLSFNGSSIRSIPESISKLRNLQVLDVRSFDDVPQLPDALFSLTSLKVLKCDEITKFNFALLPQLFNLEELELHSGKELAVDLSGISSLHKLRHLKLNLFNNATIKIPHSLGALEDIETLELQAKSMDFADFTGLWQLVNLRQCHIRVESTIKLDWKRMFKNSKQLQNFTIYGVQDGENNAESLEWLQLQFLSITNNETMKDLSWLKGFQRLRKLDLDCSGIQFFSLDGLFPCLEHLELRNLRIAQSEFKDDLAASLPNLKRLTFVVALDNTWEHLPLFVTQLPKDLDGLRVEGYMRRLLMPTERSQLKVKRFTLSLRKGCMRQLPNDFFEPTDQMTLLRWAHLMGIENIPSSIASLPGLEMLGLYDHDDVVWPQLSSDNHGLGLFPRLKVLRCRKGTKVPPWLEERPDLQINFRDDIVTKVPPWLESSKVY
ncbi:adenylate cyclase-like [Selaginella moellendorffii]|uniref:adenylate cyclase-like n=1 Tax=Selaginella moellendorffii TaxID=88036 RepID=UPI000D1C27A6|nr:adenylate cyclase-like [Selaginella moellendorffii]|eukprot:XP_024522231.1 adenylate cyclase-like [Selaginella moellendorffii]